MITGLIFFSFSQAISLWERADKEIAKLDDLIFLNHWVKDLFHSAENLSFIYKNKMIPIFFGEKENAVFISSNPIIDKYKIISLVKIEFKNGSIFYSEENLFKKEFLFKDSIPVAFNNEYDLLKNIEEGRFSYLRLINGKEEWSEDFSSEKALSIPKATKIEFFYKGKKVEIISNIISDSKSKKTFDIMVF